jgi:hypothetical protein
VACAVLGITGFFLPKFLPANGSVPEGKSLRLLLAMGRVKILGLKKNRPRGHSISEIAVAFDPANKGKKSFFPHP